MQSMEVWANVVGSADTGNGGYSGPVVIAGLCEGNRRAKKVKAVWLPFRRWEAMDHGQGRRLSVAPSRDIASLLPLSALVNTFVNLFIQHREHCQRTWKTNSVEDGC